MLQPYFQRLVGRVSNPPPADSRFSQRAIRAKPKPAADCGHGGLQKLLRTSTDGPFNDLVTRFNLFVIVEANEYQPLMADQPIMAY